MFLEKKLNNWVSELRQQVALPLRLELWNGQAYNFCLFTPQVTIRLPHISAARYLLRPSLANLGTAYVEGKIDVEGGLDEIIRIGSALAVYGAKPASRLARSARPARHTRAKDAAAISYHYDVSNEFYRAWLDENLVYSCAYFEQGDEDLATAQRKKIDHILKKIRLQPGQSLLDIGCGWGALVLRAAQEFGARCVGITLSRQQFDWACDAVKRAGLSHLIEIRLQDYRDVRGQFDRITSVGMFEHVGLRQLKSYFCKIHSLLAEGGVVLNHGITSTDSKSSEVPLGVGAFIDQYVFPHGELPHIGLVLSTMQDAGLEPLDVENLRRHYARTCAIWAANFERNAAQVVQLAGQRRYRIWRVYLAGSAYAFDQDWISINQVVCAKAGRTSASLPWSRRYMYN
jgi:cyclopropane-fatty-acyl-phospholipid synthase